MDAMGMVDQLNKQEVNWTSIFTRAVTPALISGVGSMIALSITQAMQFQQALNTTGTAAGASAAQIAQVGQAAVQMSTTVPASAQDIADSMFQVSKIFGTNTDAANEVTQAMTQLAGAGFGSLNDITQASMQIFRQWGITTSKDAIAALTALMHGAEGSGQSFTALTSQVSGFSDPLVAAGIKFDSFNKIVAAFSSDIVNVGDSGAVSIFDGLAQGADKANSPMAIIAGSTAAIKKSLVDDGGLSAIQKMSSVFSSQYGNNVGLIAEKMGLTDSAVAGIVNSGKDMPKILTDAADIGTKAETISEAYAKAGSVIRDLEVDFNKVRAAIMPLGDDFKPFVDMVGSFIATAATDFDTLFKGITDKLSDLFVDLGVGGKLNIGKAITDSLSLVSTIFDKGIIQPAMQVINGAIGAVTGHSVNGLNNALEAANPSLTATKLAAIDGAAGSTAMQDSLLSALQTGIKGNQYASLVSHFNLTVPAGSEGLTAKAIAAQLYTQFQSM